MDLPQHNFQGAKLSNGGGGPPQFRNFMPYPVSKSTNLFQNIFVNHPFQRTFASVVSCNSPALNLRQNASQLVNSFLEAVIKQEPKPTASAATSKREFNDFKSMPNWRSNMDCQQKYSKCNFRSRPPPLKKFHFSPHHPQYSEPPQHSYHHQQHHNQFQKNRHEKERISIERDIRNDRCDITNRFASRTRPTFWHRRTNNNVDAKSPTCPKNPTTTTKTKTESPPFEIYSLEEFPAIVATTISMCKRSGRQSDNSTTTSNSTSNNKNINNNNNCKMEEKPQTDEHDFVEFRSDIARTTPTYVQPPCRFNLCEAVTKIVTSPKKLLNLPLSAPKRSCLKATPLKSRNMSECSDDYIVFDYTSANSCVSQDDDEEDDDDVDGMEEEEEEEDSSSSDESDDDEEMDECDRNSFENEDLQMDDDVQQPDSGVEEKRVHFNAAVKVNVIRAWDYAYREARKGDVWMQLSRDRLRFSKRIQDCEKVLQPILSVDHRQRVFAERFEAAT